ncbi:ECH1 protein, partial [Nothocercus julius]|nr:ECH1 protein [Nothocercus julius]
REMVQCFQGIARDADCRAVVLSGAGKLFSAGIDLMSFGEELVLQGEDTARRAWNLRRTIRDFQESFTVLEKCPKPVIVAVHGACIGAGEQGTRGDAGRHGVTGGFTGPSRCPSEGVDLI